VFYKLITVVAATSALLLGGCATRTPMAFSEGTPQAVKADKSVYLMSVTLKNSYKTSHQPKLYAVNVEKKNTGKSGDAINFSIDDKAREETDTVNGSTYFLRMELDKGEYLLEYMNSVSSSFPIHGGFTTPLVSTIVAGTPGVYYLGHVDATVRQRRGNEFKAGPTLPLVDQAIAGASSGSFDVDISDQWAQDEAKFKGKFPVLTSVSIQKNILPAYDRTAAQKWWETH
jgi:hypothetical protein